MHNYMPPKISYPGPLRLYLSLVLHPRHSAHAKPRNGPASTMGVQPSKNSRRPSAAVSTHVRRTPTYYAKSRPCVVCRRYHCRTLSVRPQCYGYAFDYNSRVPTPPAAPPVQTRCASRTNPPRTEYRAHRSPHTAVAKPIDSAIKRPP